MSSSRNRGSRKRENKKQKSSTKLSNVKSSPPSIKNKTSGNKSKQSIWNKGLKGISDEEEWNREDVVLIMYWIRQLLSLLIGVIWGIIRLEGILALLFYVIVCVFALHSYKSSLKVSDDMFDILDVFKEGFVPAFGIFLIAWISAYSLAHY